MILDSGLLFLDHPVNWTERKPAETSLSENFAN